MPSDDADGQESNRLSCYRAIQLNEVACADHAGINFHVLIAELCIKQCQKSLYQRSTRFIIRPINPNEQVRAVAQSSPELTECPALPDGRGKLSRVQ